MSDPETGIGSWSEADVKRALTEGVRPSGVPLAPQMPVAFYKILTPRDLDAVAAYIKTAAPVRNQVPPPVYKAAKADRRGGMPYSTAPSSAAPRPRSRNHETRKRWFGRTPTSSRGNSTLGIDLQRQGLRSWIGTVPGSGCAPQPEPARWPRLAARADPPQS